MVYGKTLRLRGTLPLSPYDRVQNHSGFPSQPGSVSSGMRLRTRGVQRNRSPHSSSVQSIQLQWFLFPTSNHQTHEPPTTKTDAQLSLFLKGCSWSTTHLLRVLLDIHVGLTVEILDFGGPQRQPSAFKDVYGITDSRGHGHGKHEEVVVLSLSTGARLLHLCPTSIKYNGHRHYLTKKY